jgi:hypothetical protein
MDERQTRSVTLEEWKTRPMFTKPRTVESMAIKKGDASHDDTIAED